MNIYRLDYRAGPGLPNTGEHVGYDYVSSARKAQRLATKATRNGHECVIDKLTVEISKRGILAALNQYAGHPDNG